MWDHIINTHPSKLLNTKTKEFIINESQKKKKKKKCLIIIFQKTNMDNLYLYLVISLQIFLKS